MAGGLGFGQFTLKSFTVKVGIPHIHGFCQFRVHPFFRFSCELGVLGFKFVHPSGCLGHHAIFGFLFRKQVLLYQVNDVPIALPRTHSTCQFRGNFIWQA